MMYGVAPLDNQSYEVAGLGGGTGCGYTGVCNGAYRKATNFNSAMGCQSTAVNLATRRKYNHLRSTQDEYSHRQSREDIFYICPR